LTVTLTFLYTINMMKNYLIKNGLLDADFIQPLVAFLVLIVIGEII